MEYFQSSALLSNVPINAIESRFEFLKYVNFIMEVDRFLYFIYVMLLKFILDAHSVDKFKKPE